MKGGISVFTRCCVCVPLRRGLIAWGYFKMIVDTFYLWVISSSLIDTVTMFSVQEKEENLRRFYTDLSVSMIGITIFFTDLIVTIMFIIGGYTKNVQLIRVFYYLSMVMWVLTFLLTDAVVVISVQHFVARSTSFDMLLMIVSFYIMILASQTYFLILLRSEIIKLKKMDQFKHEKNPPEIQYTLKCEEIKEDLKKAHN